MDAKLSGKQTQIKVLRPSKDLTELPSLLSPLSVTSKNSFSQADTLKRNPTFTSLHCADSKLPNEQQIAQNSKNSLQEIAVQSPTNRQFGSSQASPKQFSFNFFQLPGEKQPTLNHASSNQWQRPFTSTNSERHQTSSSKSKRRKLVKLSSLLSSQMQSKILTSQQSHYSQILQQVNEMEQVWKLRADEYQLLDGQTGLSLNPAQGLNEYQFQFSKDQLCKSGGQNEVSLKPQLIPEEESHKQCFRLMQNCFHYFFLKIKGKDQPLRFTLHQKSMEDRRVSKFKIFCSTKTQQPGKFNADLEVEGKSFVFKTSVKKKIFYDTFIYLSVFSNVDCIASFSVKFGSQIVKKSDPKKEKQDGQGNAVAYLSPDRGGENTLNKSSDEEKEQVKGNDQKNQRVPPDAMIRSRVAHQYSKTQDQHQLSRFRKQVSPRQQEEEQKSKQPTNFQKIAQSQFQTYYEKMLKAWEQSESESQHIRDVKKRGRLLLQQRVEKIKESKCELRNRQQRKLKEKILEQCHNLSAQWVHLIKFVFVADKLNQAFCKELSCRQRILEEVRCEYEKIKSCQSQSKKIGGPPENVEIKE